MSNRRSPIKDWTLEERKQLLSGLKKYGHQNLDSLTKELPSRSKIEITRAIGYYRLHANRKVSSGNLCTKPKHTMASKEMPLMQWSKILIDNLDCDKLQTLLPLALRLIAEHEEHPPANQCNGINFAELYSTLASILEGNIPKTLCSQKHFILKKTLVDCSLNAVMMQKTEHLDFILSLLRIFPDPIEEASLSTDEETAAIRHLIVTKEYNPFNIPLNLCEYTNDPLAN